MPLLEVTGMGVDFGGLRALSDFEITIEEGELVGLIGPNGAGKTTAFNLLTGVYEPTEGEIKLQGISIGGKKPYYINNLGIARTFQNIRLFKGLSVIENVKTAFHASMSYGLISGIFRLPKFWREEKAIHDEALELLDVFGMADMADANAGNLPYGKQRQLEIARALATHPKLLLLDEPAAGMNPSETQLLMDTIQLIRERFKIAILLIEHDMKLVMGICQRMVVLDYGMVIATGRPEEIKNNPRVIEAYLGE
ncbi:MAG: ABC transporter ATP-binding protein [Defluviitaleaceae bacterium]|nr:ABC transporter ATP-binding protein [Defluviitaleaceae bacterium]